MTLKLSYDFHVEYANNAILDLDAAPQALCGMLGEQNNPTMERLKPLRNDRPMMCACDTRLRSLINLCHMREDQRQKYHVSIAYLIQLTLTLSADIMWRIDSSLLPCLPMALSTETQRRMYLATQTTWSPKWPFQNCEPIFLFETLALRMDSGITPSRGSYLQSATFQHKLLDYVLKTAIKP